MNEEAAITCLKCIACGGELPNGGFYSGPCGPYCWECYDGKWMAGYSESRWIYEPETHSYKQVVTLDTVVEKLDMIIKLLEKEHGEVEKD